jgi:hypothetical protein
LLKTEQGGDAMQIKDDTADNDYQQQQQQCAHCNSTYCICNYDASDDNKDEYESDENEYDDDDYDDSAHNNAPAKAITGICSHVEHL